MIYMPGGTVLRHPFVLADNLVSGAALLAASSTAAGFPAAAAGTENTYQAWRAGVAGEAWILSQFSEPRSIDTMALVGHNIHRLGGARLLFGYRADLGASYTYAPVNAYPTDGGPAVVALPAPVSAREVLFYVPATPVVPTGVFSAAVLMAGLRLDLAGVWVQPEYTRAPDAVTVEGEAAISRGGHYLGATIRRRGGRLAPQFSPLERAWADTNLRGFRAHHDARRPFLFASAPSIYPDDVAYCWRADGAPELQTPLIGGGAAVRMAMELDFHAP